MGRKRRTDRPGQIGQWWLSRHGSEQWRRTWYERDPATGRRRTCRASLGDGDFRDFETASLALAEWVVANRTLRNAPAADVELEGVLVRYYETHARHLPSGDSAKTELRFWSERFPGRMVGDLTPAALDDFARALLAQGYARSYVGRIFDTGRAALNWSAGRGELAAAPAVPMVETAAQRRARPPMGRPLSLEEMVRLVGAIALGAEHLQHWLVIAGCTLARPEAAFDLGAFAVDRAHDRVDLNPLDRMQTKKHRPIVPIARTLAPWLVVPAPARAQALERRARRGRAGVACDRFVQYAGRPVASIGKAFRAARAAAGLDDRVTPYSIRHTLARWMRARGVPKEQRDAMMGHLAHGPGTTGEIYAPYDPAYCADAIAAIDAFWDQVRAELFAGVHAAMQQDDVAEERRSA
jgi:integrase